MSTPELLHIIELVVGDFSGDGHGQTDTTVIRSNLSPKEIRTAYQLGVNKSGVELFFIARDYEDGCLYSVDAQKLVAAGLNPDNYVEEMPGKILHKYGCNAKRGYECYCTNYVEVPWDDPDASASMSGESFTRLYIDLIKLGNPDFEYEVAIKDYTNRIHIGGYGLLGG